MYLYRQNKFLQEITLQINKLFKKSYVIILRIYVVGAMLRLGLLEGKRIGLLT